MIWDIYRPVLVSVLPKIGKRPDWTGLLSTNCDAARTQTDHNGSKMRWTRRETEQRAWGKGGEHAKDKGRGHTRYACHFIFNIIFTNFCFSQKQDPPPPNIKNTPVWACLGVRQSPLPFRHVADALIGVCYVSFWPNTTDSPFLMSLSHLVLFFLTPPPLQIHCRCPKGHLQRISFTTRDKHASFSVSVAFSCVLSRQPRKRVPYRTRFCGCYISEHQRAHFGRVGGLQQVFHSQTRRNVPCASGTFLHVRLHFLPIRTPLTYPNGYISGVRLLVYHPNPSL